MRGSYVHTLALALDQFAAAIFFNRSDCTISSLCRCVQLMDTQAPEWRWRVTRVLKLGNWQIVALRAIGRALNATFSNHCEAARLSDLSRAGSTIQLLNEP